MFFSYAFKFNLSILDSLLVISIINFGIILPSSPGYIGTFEYFCVQSLFLFEISQEQAIAFAILFHAVQFIIMSVLGILYINIQGLSWKRFREETDYVHIIDSNKDISYIDIPQMNQP